MINKWFRWERQACIHLLFPTLEAFYPLLTSYSGVSAPTMILVFAEGVVTSHAAIISRELKIPCIVGTRVTTKILKNGDLVEVDANRGVVKII